MRYKSGGGWIARFLTIVTTGRGGVARFLTIVTTVRGGG